MKKKKKKKILKIIIKKDFQLKIYNQMKNIIILKIKQNILLLKKMKIIVQINI